MIEKQNSTQTTSPSIPCSYAYYIKCSYDDRLSKYVHYRGTDCISNFITTIRLDLSEIGNGCLSRTAPVQTLSKAENSLFIQTVSCHICKKLIIGNKCQNHCPFSGEFMGAAHFSCIENLKCSFNVPIYFSFSNKSNLLILVNEMWSHIDPSDKFETNGHVNQDNLTISLIISLHNSKSMKTKYLELRFIECCQILPWDLENLVKHMKNNDFKEVSNKFGSQNLDLILKQGIPHTQFIDSFQKWQKAQVPVKAAFFSSLAEANISPDQIEHAEKVWSSFDLKTNEEYLDIYLKRNVFILCDVVEKMRILLFETYELDVAHYFNTPEFSWDAMLKHTNIELELICDISVAQFIKNGIRDGLSFCTNGLSISNNKFIPDYDSKKPSTFIINLELNTLYNLTMSQFLPSGNFRWLTEHELKYFKIEQIDTDNSTGYILEVDLEYPQNIHDFQHDFPFCCEKLNLNSMSTLDYIRKYIIYHKRLIQCLSNGLKLTTIHRVLKFSQSCFLEEFIDLNLNNSEKTNELLEKKLYQCLNEALMDKINENPDHNQEIELCASWNKTNHSVGANDLITLPYFESTTIVDKNFVMVEMKPFQKTLNKPYYYLKFCLQELAKTHIYDFHYNYMKQKYQNNVRLLYIDTDFLVYEIETDNFYADMIDNPWFDTCIGDQNEPIIGAFVDVFRGNPLLEFTGFNLKRFTLKYSNNICLGIVKKEENNIDNSLEDS